MGKGSRGWPKALVLSFERGEGMGMGMERAIEGRMYVSGGESMGASGGGGGGGLGGGGMDGWMDGRMDIGGGEASTST